MGLIFERTLEVYNSLRDTQASPEFLRVKGLGEIVVRSGTQAGNNVRDTVLSSQKNEITIRSVGISPNISTNLRTTQARHYPVQNRQFRRILLLQCIPGANAIGDAFYLIIRRKKLLQHLAEKRVVFSDQRFHSSLLRHFARWRQNRRAGLPEWPGRRPHPPVRDSSPFPLIGGRPAILQSLLYN